MTNHPPTTDFGAKEPLGIASHADRQRLPTLLTVEQVACELAISSRQVWRLLGSGEIRKVSVGRAARVTRESVEKFIARGGSP